MKRTFWIFIAALLVLTSLDATAQRWKLRRYELDAYISWVAFHGDIGLADRPLGNMFNGSRPSVGLTPRFMLRKDMAVSLDLAYVIYGGADDDNGEHGRIYTFNSNAFQHLARFEYFILGEGKYGSTGSGIYNRRGMVNNYKRLNLYVFAGAGGIMSKAKIKDQDGNEPLTNPGYFPGLQYTAAFPVGGGVKLSLDPRWSVGVELGYQFTLSDKLDGYKPIYSHYNDSYYLFCVKAIMRIRNDSDNRPIFNKYYR
jgi:opacity protein-like surface antigen